MQKRITVEINPMPATRPRVRMRGRTPLLYKEPRYRDWSDAAAAEIAAMDLGPPFAGHVRVSIRAYFKRARTSKLLYPNPDVDNVVKAIMDAATQAKNVWLDDKQVVYVDAFKDFTIYPAPGFFTIAVSTVDDPRRELPPFPFNL